MSPSNLDILVAAVARVKGDSAIMTAVGNRVYNHLPQETPLPAIRVRWSQANEWDTKDSDGVDGYLFLDVWSNERGDKEVSTIADMLVNLFHLQPLSLPAAQSLILRRDFYDTFTEPDGLTHHAVVRLHHIATT